MLSERDRRTLHEMELHLLGEDPRLGTAMQQHARADRWARRGYDATIVVAGVLALTCLLLSGVGGGGAGLVAAILAVVVWVLRRRRFSVPDAPPPSPEG
jgi:uncharacterized protein (TIGR03382 family)